MSKYNQLQSGYYPSRWVTLPCTCRSGILTHSGWLAHGRNFDDDPSLVHRVEVAGARRRGESKVIEREAGWAANSRALVRGQSAVGTGTGPRV